jgi:hypothetical protein
MAHKTDLVPYPAKQIKFSRIHRASDSITSSHVPPEADKCFCTFPPCESWDPFLHLIISYIYIYILVWLVPLAQVWTHYKIGKLNMWTSFCNVCIDFFEQPNMKGKPSSVTTFSTDFLFQYLVFLEFIWIFSGRNHLKHNISPTFWIQIWPNKFH